MAKTKTSGKKAKRPPQKRGNKGDFHGLRLEYLNSRLPAYHYNGNKMSFTDFWAETFTGYWQRFPWTVPLTTEPVEPSDEEEDISKLSAEELHQRAMIMSTIEKVYVHVYCVYLITYN